MASKTRLIPDQPLDKDVYDLSPEELSKVPSMPDSLEDALDALERDPRSFSKAMCSPRNCCDTYIEYKREKEVAAVRLRPHPYEFSSITTSDNSWLEAE